MGNLVIKRIKKIIFAFFLIILILNLSQITFAQSSSTNYIIEESFFGTGGELDASSTNYRARLSAGEMTVGNSVSTNYQVQAGFNTTDVPYLEMTVNGGTLDLGSLNDTSTKTGTVTFSVRSYLSSGYIVSIVGTPPTNEYGNTIAPMAVTGASSTGTEQFGLNLRANTSPTTFGADPVQSPDNSFSFGQVDADYNTVNQYRYVVGETIAYSNSSSGATTYTASYIVNISSITEAGLYTTDQVFVATATF